MGVPHVLKKPVHRSRGGRLQSVGVGRLESAFFSKRSPRRQLLTKYLHALGPRPLLEALIEIEAGRALDGVLADFARLDPAVVSALGADVLPIDQVAIIDGGA
jgi:hypothetical protein